MRSQQGTQAIIAVFVDDLIILSDSKVELTEIKTTLSTAFKMKDLGEIKHCLGITVERDENKLSIHQKYSVEQILDKFHMLNCNAAATPMDTNVKLCRDDGVSKPVEPKRSQSLIESLLYVATATRPDIAVAVGELSKYNAHPNEAR